ncbi:hypothetical protein [Vitiosangium sp. GDMCC 1.1324]|uniref:hypothetical protein n=1 Tax=Vitiosangium sp. (strain GDMCC 1.1324) TaxID=2138576 RepID=UPI0011B7A63E|nr:hypothetical protein [Vitiosangium sp. GDMCC 1.1324]
MTSTPLPKLPFLNLLSDLFDRRRPGVLKKTLDAFVKDPDKVMQSYGLSDPQKKALKSQDFDQIAREIIEELKTIQCIDPNW